MEEVEKTTEEEVVAAPEVENKEAEVQETAQAKNFRALREQNEAMARELEEAKSYMQNMEANKPKVAESVSDDDDDLVEVRHLRKVNQKMEVLQDQIAENSLISKFPDFHSVVNESNIKKLIEDYPELAHSIDSNKDMFTKKKAAYTLIKKLKIGAAGDNTAEFKKAQGNADKPMPLSSANAENKPFAHADAYAQALTEDKKREVYMQALRDSGEI